MLCFSSAGWKLPSQPIMVFVRTIKLENTFLGVTKSLATLARKLKKKKLTTCCSVKETQREMHPIRLHTNSSSTAQYRELLPGLWAVATLQGSAAGLYPLFLSHGAVPNLLPHQQSAAALTGQSILAGESDPAQGQSRKVVTLPISQVENHET